MHALIGCFLLSAAFAFSYSSGAQTIDLRQESFEDHRVHRISADWEVFWGELLTPQDFVNGNHRPSELRPYKTPITPSKTLHQGQPHSFRHGTFRLQIALPPHSYPFAIFVPEIRGASRLWLNGVEVLTEGVIGTELESESLRMHIHTINIPVGVTHVELILQNSSYSFAKIGPYTPLAIGPRLNVDFMRWQPMFRDTFVLSAILIMAFYHFALYLVRGKGIEPVLFACFCLSMSLITLTRSEGLLVYQLFEHPNSYICYKLSFAALPVSASLMGYYARRLYPVFLPKWLFSSLLTSAIIFGSIVVFGPLRATDYCLVYFQGLVVAVGCMYIGCLVRAAWCNADSAKLFMAGFVIIVSGAINDFLRANGVPTIVVSHMTLFAFILIQSVILSRRFAKAFILLESAEGEIRVLNSELEKKVEERTATIRMILDHVKSGFLLIDHSFKVQPGFTKSCEDILEHVVQPGDSFTDFFTLTQRQRGDLHMALVQVFEDVLPESVSLSMIKNRLPIKNRQVTIQSAVIRDHKQAIQSILITLTDATHVAQMEKEAKLNQVLVKILHAQVNFKSLLAESFSDLERSKNLLGEDGQKAVKMILHTIKGNFASFGLDEIAQSVHEIEDRTTIAVHNIEDLSQKIQQFLELYKDILKIDPASLHEKSYRLHDSHLVRLSDRLRSRGASREVLDTFAVWMEEIKQISFEELIGPIGKKARSIGESLGKKVELVIHGGNIPVDADRLQSVIHSLIHLVRNSIDHGLEFPDERGEKPETGEIFIRVRRDDKAFHIEAGDDGRGIDLALIREVAVGKGLISLDEASKLSDQESLALIFRSGFSTRDEVTSLSGRGVGMSAIESAVLELGGKISIQTKLGVGTCFHIEIPEGSQPAQLRESA